jgi:ribosomal-protein-alanine N-acetyltransferase
LTKTEILTELSEEQYSEITRLWEITGVTNPARGDTLEVVRQTLAGGGKIILVREDGKAVGTVWLTSDFRRLYIHHMAVHPDWQNRGYGKLLMQDAQKIASELKLQVKLEVHKDNKVAFELYKKYGFTTLEGYLSMIKRDT